MKKEESLKKVEYQVAAFYKFLSLLDEDIVFIKEELSELAKNREIKGTTLLASEGINGTVCAKKNAITQFIERLKQLLKRYCKTL